MKKRTGSAASTTPPEGLSPLATAAILPATELPPDPAISGWVEAYLSEVPPRSKSLVATVIGDAIAPHGGKIWMGSLIELLQPFNFNDRLVRTSVFRLTEDGMLESRREGRRALYTLTASGKKRFERAHRRIYLPPALHWDGNWTLVMTPRLGHAEVDRVELRRELGWLGFAAIAPGILAHPAADLAALREVLEGLELLDTLYVLQAHDLPGFGALPAQQIVAQCWSLDGLAAAWRDFIRHFQPVLDISRTTPALHPRQAFQIRTLLIHAYRRTILNDPLFPVDILPPDWPGHTAYQLCRDLYKRCCQPAEQHLAGALGLPAGLPLAEPYCYTRFC